MIDTSDPAIAFAPDFQERLRMFGQRFSLAAGQEQRLELEPASGLQ